MAFFGGSTSIIYRQFSITIVSSMLLSVLVYAIGQPGAERNHVGFQSVYLILAAGVGASFLTGDLFTLFVAFEMMLTASYVLITLGARRDQVRAGMTYVVISLLASALLLVVDADRALVAAGHKDHLLYACGPGFLHGVLNQWFVYHWQHFFRAGFRGR